VSDAPEAEDRPDPRPGILDDDEDLAESVDREPGLWVGRVEIHGDIVGSDPEITDDFLADPDPPATP